MFGIGFLEICVICIVGLIFIGPKKLPEVITQLGKLFVQLRRMSNEVKSSFDSVVEDAQKEDLDNERKRQAYTQKPLEAPKESLQSDLTIDIEKENTSSLDKEDFTHQREKKPKNRPASENYNLKP